LGKKKTDFMERGNGENMNGGDDELKSLSFQRRGGGVPAISKESER